MLAAMNRRHTRADYLRTVERLRAARPDIALSSRFHRRLSRRDRGGFPRHAARSSTRSAMPSAFSFKYSPRPGHARRPTDGDQVAEDVKIERLARLQAAIDRHQAGLQPRCVGRTFDVLFEKPGRHAGPDRRPLALSAAGPGHGAVIIDRRHRCRWRSPDVGVEQPVRHACASATPCGRRRRPQWEPDRVAQDAHPIPDRSSLLRPRRSRRPRSCSPSTTTGSPRRCSANTARTSR